MRDRSDELRSVPGGDGQIVATLKPDMLDGLLALTIPGYATEVMRLHHQKVERLILEGNNEIEVVYPPDRWRDGDEARRVLYTVPLWRLAFKARLTVEWRRWRYRHPEAGTNLLTALSWSGTVWSSGHIPPR